MHEANARAWMPMRIQQLEADNDDLRQRLQDAQAIADRVSSERNLALSELAKAKRSMRATELHRG